MFFRSIARFIKSTPNRSFLIYPALVLIGEYLLRQGKLVVEPYAIALMAWGYGQYRFCGAYRIKIGGGGPGLEKPPERLVTSGIYRYTRNPMYLGHIIFLTGLSLTLKSLPAAFLALATAAWFHYRVLGDERRLVDLFGEPYLAYARQVRRWIPGLL